MALTKSRQEIVSSYLTKILQRGDLPAFSEHINQVMAVVSDDEQSMRHIIDVILRDVSFSLKVMRTANSARYNRSGRQLRTVTHAVSLVGLDAVRNMAGSMLLLKHFWDKSAGTKELSMLSLLTACHARQTANKAQYKEPEEAYVCGMLRNIGELLVSGYLPRKYAAILKRREMPGMGEEEASLKVLGCSQEDLGRAALRHWKMPDRIRHSIQPDIALTNGTVSGQLDVLRNIVSFSHALTEAVHRSEPGAASAQINSLLMKYSSTLPLDRPAIEEIVSNAIDDTKATFDVLRIPFDHLRLRQQTEAAFATVDALWSPEIDPEDGEPLPHEELLEALVEDVELALCRDSQCDINRIARMVLDAILRGVGFDRVVFAMVSPENRMVCGRLGVGERIDPFVESFRFPLSIRSGPVAVALMGKQDIFINDDRYATTPFGRTVRAKAFGLMPVVVTGVALGLFYFDRKDEGPDLTVDEVHHLKHLRSLFAETIERSRRESGAA